MSGLDKIEMSWIVNARPKAVFDAWLSSEGHSEMTGGQAVVDGEPGGAFTAWDGYIWGATKKVEKNRKVVQSWRTADFSKRSPDSKIEVEFRPFKGKTQLVLKHTKLQKGDGAKYTLGWYQFYIEPMLSYFGES
jgi:activator of HSP90 ATPase